MIFDVKTQVIANLTIQVLLIMAVSGAVYLAKTRNLEKHCMVLRATVLLQLIAIASIMLPSMLGYIAQGQDRIFFSLEMLLHHTLGLAVIVIWIYINFVISGVIRMKGRLVAVMRLALASWIIALIIGLHLYFQIWM